MNKMINKSIMLSNNKRLLSKLEQKIDTNKYNILNEHTNDLKIVLDSLNGLKKNVINDNKQFIEQTINDGLTFVFDTNVYIEISILEPTKSRKNTRYDIIYYQDGVKLGDNSSILQSDGGSLLHVISFLFKIIINKLIGNTIIMIDEDLSQLSKSYLPNMSKLIQSISRNFNMTIVIVTHDKQLAKNADKIYYLNKTDINTSGILKITNVVNKANPANINAPKYTLNIKNFQSIKDISFDYVGFTIIVGSGRIGKSASFRAMRSLIYGTFKQNFCRLNTTEPTVIELIYNNNSAKLISLNGKVKYNLNGSIYHGINKAKSKLREFFLEEFGINYVDTSIFKSTNEIKKMLDSIVCGTQFDSTLLVGSSSGQLDSTLESLFNTSTIVTAIANCQNDFNKSKTTLDKMKFEYDKVIERIKELKLENEKLEQELYALLYDIIDMINNDLEQFNIEEQCEQRSRKEQQIHKYKHAFYLNEINKLLCEFNELEEPCEPHELTEKIHNLEQLYHGRVLYDLICEIEDNLVDDDNQLNVNNKEKLNNKINLLKIVDKLNTLNKLTKPSRQKLDLLNKELDTILQSSTPCPTCLGSGIIYNLNK